MQAWRLLAVLFLLVIAAPSRAVADPFQELNLLRPARGAVAADFTISGPAGETVALRAERGKLVLLNFWATWCPPCREEMPSMERLYRRFKARGFTILAISIDTGDPAAVAAFAKTLGLTFPIGLDPKLEVANHYAIRGLPASFLIDRSGHIVAIALGPRDWDSRSAHAIVEALLK